MALIIVIIQQTIALIGIILNLPVVWITIKNKNLHSSFGLLLAVYSFCEFCLETTTFFPTLLIWIDLKIEMLTCFYLSAFQTFWGGTNAAFALFFISFDRLIALLFPYFYRFVLSRGAFKYVILLNTISSTYIFVLMYFNYYYLWKSDNEFNKRMVNCEISDHTAVEIFDWAFYNVIILYFLTLIIYILIGIIFKFKKSEVNPEEQMQQTRRIFKSLATIMGVIFFLYFSSVFLTKFVVPILTDNPEMATLLFTIFAQLITIAGAINAPVLYFCSSEYREIMNRHFPFIRPVLHFCRVSSIDETTNLQISTTIFQPKNSKIIPNRQNQLVQIQ